VIKSLRDRIPKTITFLLINKMSEFIEHNLMSHFYENDLVSDVMTRSDLELEKFEKLKAMKDACREALKVIGKKFKICEIFILLFFVFFLDEQMVTLNKN
jgi:hypothetical protein